VGASNEALLFDTVSSGLWYERGESMLPNHFRICVDDKQKAKRVEKLLLALGCIWNGEDVGITLKEIDSSDDEDIYIWRY